MKVRELAAQLAKMDQELEVYAYTEDPRFATDERPFWLLEVAAIATAAGVMHRDSNGAPIMTFDSGSGSRRFVTIEVTSDY